MSIDATSIKLDLPFATYGYHSLTKTIEKRSDILPALKRLSDKYWKVNNF
jgi:hypothetical protein